MKHPVYSTFTFLADALKEFGKMIDSVEDERDRMVNHFVIESSTLLLEKIKCMSMISFFTSYTMQILS